MVARHFTELVVWQLADELRREVVAFTATLPACRDRKFCDQIRNSSESVCSLTAEGFGRFLPGDFRNFLRMAKGSLDETQDRLKGGLMKGYLTQADFGRMWALSVRAVKANVGLQNYLRRSGRFGPRKAQQHRHHTSPNPEPNAEPNRERTRTRTRTENPEP
jgi:four helix bundle protein